MTNVLNDTLSDLLAAAPDPMLLVDGAGNIVFANLCIESIFGYTPGEIVGLPVETLIPERHHVAHVGHRHSYLENPRARPMGTMELNGRHKDGTELSVEVSLGPFESEDGPLVWVAIRDGALHKRLAQEKAFSDSLLETVPAIILLLDGEGRIIRINHYMAELAGYAEHEVAGKDWFTTFLPDEDQMPMRDLLEDVMRTGVNSGHVNPIVTRAGVLRHIEWQARTLADEHGRTVLLNVGHDVTERMVYEQGLLRAKEALQEADRHKDDFLAMLGHEMRSPLGAVSVALESLSLVSDGSAARKALDLMRRQVKRLSLLLDDLRDTSYVARGTLRISQQRVDLNDIVKDCVSGIQPFVDEAGHSLSLTVPQDPVAVYVDPARMAQVLENLLLNSVKYTPHGGHIDVWLEPATGGARVSVKDDGVGIPPEHLETVFEPFVRLKSTGPGQGIGLSLAKTIIEMHGGRIVANSAGPGQGSEFVVWIPTYAAMEGRGGAQRQPEPDV